MRMFRKILIFGGCVSRDIFNLAGVDNIGFVDYYARSVFSSAFSKPVESVTPDFDAIPSSFQRSCVKRDFYKTFSKTLGSLEFDLILVDFLSNRFDLYETAEGELFTISEEFKSTGFDLSNAGGVLIKRGSEQYKELWLSGFDRFVHELRKLEIEHKLILNKPYYTSTLDSGNPMKSPYTQSVVHRLNKELDFYYKHAETSVKNLKTIEYPKDLIIGAESHRWGAGPLHYIDSLYYYAANYLTSVEEKRD